ncbi:MAG: lysophospholipid acyltransferase family protein [Bacteroidetes bacterium]|nr:lysophospholipid acyltransferase family protein [Bacteroidota bacterium]
MRILQALGRLPKGVLSLLAWMLTLVALAAGGYRGKVVRANLRRAFPDLSWAGRTWRFVQFQRHFTQLLVESAKLFHMSRQEVDSGMVHVGTELMEQLHAQGKHVLIAGGHMNNWEWSALTLSQNLPFRTMALYKKLSDDKGEKAMKESRSRFGLEMVRTKEGREWMDAASKGNPVAVVMGFDQSPADPSKCWWTTFMGVETAVFYGLEQWSRRYDMAVVYASIRREAPWKYTLHYELVADEVLALPEGEVLDRCLTKLEREIHRDPARWLWSHKRWKHRRPEGQPLHSRNHTVQLP